MNQLQSKLSSFDIPATRRNLDNFDNVAWLVRNLRIKNQHNPKLKEVTVELFNLFREKVKELS